MKRLHAVFPLCIGWLLLPLCLSVAAQTSSFTYQGRLNDNNLPANVAYDFQFRLFDAASGGNEIGTLNQRLGVQVTNGLFNVSLDFGAAAFPGAARFLDISVRQAGGGGFTTLTPRRALNSVPYAIQSLNAATATNATNATTAVNFSGALAGDVTGTQAATAIANGAVTTTKLADGSVTNAKIADVAGSKVTGTIPVAGVPAGSGNYVQNTTTLQTGNFNISGNGIIGGNVGIGTTAPGAKLEVRAGSNGQTGPVEAIRIGGPNAPENANSAQDLKWAFTGAGSAGLRAYRGNSWDTYLQFLTNLVSQGSDSPQIRMHINHNGNVGIGTTTPTFAKLDVRDTNTVVQVRSSLPTLITGSDNGGAIYFGLDNANSGNIPTAGIETSWGGNSFPQIGIGVTRDFFTGNTASMVLDYGGNTNIRQGTTSRLFVQGSTGNVGIGTTSPDQKLTVNGNASKAAGGTTWAVFSDERLKNIKGRFTPGLSALLQLQPIRYEYKADNALGLKGNSEEVGFSAQAVEKVLPEAVSRSQQGYLQLNSDPILWTMLNSIKELKAENDALKEQNDALKKATAAIEARLAALEKLLQPSAPVKQ